MVVDKIITEVKTHEELEVGLPVPRIVFERRVINEKVGLPSFEDFGSIMCRSVFPFIYKDGVILTASGETIASINCTQ